MTHSENVIYINKTRCHVYRNYINKVFRATKGKYRKMLIEYFTSICSEKNWLIISYVFTFPITLYLLQRFPTEKNRFWF